MLAIKHNALDIACFQRAPQKMLNTYKSPQSSANIDDVSFMHEKTAD